MLILQLYLAFHFFYSTGLIPRSALLSKIISLVARYVIDSYCLSGSLFLLVIRYD